MPNSRQNIHTKERGAKQAKLHIMGRMQAYSAHHKVSLITSFRKLISRPIQTLLTTLVVAIALALPATMLIALKNVQTVGKNLNTQPKLSVYLNQKAKPNAIDAFIVELNLNATISRVTFKTADEALQAFKLTSGMGDALELLDENPLPPTIIVEPQAAAIDPVILDALASEIGASPLVDEVVFDMGWVRRLIDIMVLLETLVLALACMLGVGVLLAVGNTIRLEIESRRDEIVVTKLVGGTNAFVRRPLLYTGLLYGVFGALCASFIVLFALLALSGPVASLAASYQSSFTLNIFGLSDFISLVLLGAGLGLSGAWLAVGRELSNIEP